jgi:DNA-directed RNA polymerase specialized sigma24 family protein
MKGVRSMVEPASTAEIVAAIRALTEADAGHLKRYAVRRLEAIGRAAGGKDWEDLIQEGIARTLAGTRIWNKNAVPFVGHLMGVVKSICSGMAENLAAEKNEEPMSESELIGATTNPDLNPYQLAVSPMPTAEEITEARDAVDAIKRFFHDDPLVLEIVSCIEEGFNGPEIKELLGISQKDLETAMRKLRRAAPMVLA